jgi:enamine deaminase RidA (YjgF/YER057c/UK114 family)
MNQDVFVQFSPLPAAQPTHAGIAEEHVLGMARLGPPHGAETWPWPVQSIPMPVLGGETELLHECWHTDQPCRRGHFQDVHYSRCDNALFGVLYLHEGMMPVDGQPPLQRAAEHAYRQIFSLLQAEGLPYLCRVWNYIPDINRIEHGLERYRQFNIGRHQAFATFERPVDSSPAACALGVAQGPLTIAFLAMSEPTVRIENPRQVSAFAYPAKYGPRSPTFTRAALLRQEAGEMLLISGTASIIGHQTMHPSDVVAQTRESLANISVLLEQAVRAGTRTPFTLDDLLCRVYIRHAEDYPLVRAELEQQAPAIRAVYLQSDICRLDLLVEIEALAAMKHPT